MPVMCPVDLDVITLRTEVQTIYSRVATAPDGPFHFHRGPLYAVERLGYDAAELAALPDDVTASFAGVGNPHVIGRIPVHAVVLDVGLRGGHRPAARRATGRTPRSTHWCGHDRGHATPRGSGSRQLRTRQR